MVVVSDFYRAEGACKCSKSATEFRTEDDLLSSRLQIGKVIE